MTDRELIAEARRVAPGLRASGSDRDRLAGWLLDELATIAERAAAREPAMTAGRCGTCRGSGIVPAASCACPGPHTCTPRVCGTCEGSGQAAALTMEILAAKLNANSRYRSALRDAESDSWDGPGIDGTAMIEAANERRQAAAQATEDNHG